MNQADYAILLQEANEAILDAANRAYKKLTELLSQGIAAETAMQMVTAQFDEEYIAILAFGLAEVTGIEQNLAQIRIGDLKLSDRLYANAEKISLIVEGVILDHRRGLQDARELALELYEGYGFRPEERLVINPNNDAIPKYLRKALLPDPGITRDMDRAFARAQTKALKTGALRAAYTELLQALEVIENGKAADYLDKKLQVAFEEKMRYFAKRIAETELHRAFAIEQARELVDDPDVEYVQYRMSPAHPVEDICDFFAGVDRYGLGPGVYPKLEAPVAPAHPFCKCVLSPRLDIRKKESVQKEDADLAFFRKLSAVEQRKVAGSKAKLDRVLLGESPWDVHNANIDQVYKVKTVGEVAY